MADRAFLGRYKTIRLLGEGGMGKVYLARQLDQDRQVVVKVMHEQLAAQHRFREVFRQEMELMQRLQHPHAAAFYEGSADGPDLPCFVMEYVEGVPLDEVLHRHGRLSPERVGRLLGQMCSVLQAAHSQGIIHRDLKPGNIMVLDADAPHERIKVMDFGVAKLAAGSTSTPHLSFEKLTSAAVQLAVGTPEYLCPEQARGDEMDHRGDLYSVGVMLYELLAGQRPFDAPNRDDLMKAHMYEPPLPFAKAGVDNVSPAIEAVVMACLAKYPSDRPQQARDLAERYQEALGQKIVVEDEPRTDPPALPQPAAKSAAAAISPDDLKSGRTVVYQMEAWMPEQIAVMKLRGFLADFGGEVVESRPGLVRVCLFRRRQAPKPAAQEGFWSWLGFGGKAEPTPQVELIDMELYLENRNRDKPNQLHMTLLLRQPDRDAAPEDADWRGWCDEVYGQVSAYLIVKR